MQTSGTGAGGAAGNVVITAGVGGAETGSGAGTGGTGGDVIITPGAGGTGNTAGIAGVVWNRSPLQTCQFIPTATITADTTTITVAQLRAGVLVCSRTNDADLPATLPTGDVFGAAMKASHADEDSFMFTVINLGASARTVTITTASDFNVVGNMVVPITSSGLFMVRRTADTVYTIYRIAGA